MKKETWQRPKSTKLYLQPPLSERIALICPDMKLLDLSLRDDGTHVGQNGVGVIFLHGEELCGFDPDETAFRPVEGGIPVYEAQNGDAVQTRLEAFCDFERNPTIFFKVTVVNRTSEAVCDRIAIMPRSGRETYMLNQHQEGYSPYRPNYKNWFMLKRTWKNTEGDLFATDGTASLRIDAEGLDAYWLGDDPQGRAFAASDCFTVNYRVEAGESIVFCGSLRAYGELPQFDYQAERERTVGEWKRIVESIKVAPDTEDERYLVPFRHLAVTLTQMLARYEGSELVATRQGDVGRFVWPYESVQTLNILDRIGLSEHTFEAFRYFCERWFVSEGEDRGKIGSRAGWENFTGSVIWGISEHLKRANDRSQLEYFMPYLLAMRDWIERKRNSPRTVGKAGLFPSGKGSDWGDVAQFWTFTDSHNAMAFRSMYEMLDQYGEPESAVTKAMYDDYARVIEEVRDQLHAGHEEDEIFILPHELGIPFEDSETYSYYTDGAPYLLYTGFIAPGSLIHRQMEAFFRKRGQFENGLTGRMTSCSSMWDEAYFGGYGDVWYTMQSEIYWVKSWMACGEREKAFETLRGIMRYGMTEEYAVAERYCSINPWYSPWQPNGSGSARFIEILLECFGEKRI